MAGGPPGPPGAPGVPARKPCISHLSLQAADPTGCRKRCTCLLSEQHKPWLCAAHGRRQALRSLYRAAVAAVRRA